MGTLSTQQDLTIDQDLFVDEGESVQFKNQTIILNGNITINATGRLFINNVTLILNNTQSRSIKILVQSNGNFYITNSIIKANINASCSTINLCENSTGKFIGTEFTNLGVGEGNSSGILIKTNSMELNNCIIKNSDYGITGKNIKTKIENCEITDCKIGIRLLGISNVTAIDTLIDGLEIDSDASLIIKKTLMVRVIFTSPKKMPIKDADLKIINNNQIIYSTACFGGTQPKTNSDGEILPILVTDKECSGSDILNFNTSISVKYESRALYNDTISLNESKLLLVTFTNQQPVLSFSSVNPNKGKVGSIFKFKVRYSDADGDAPEKIQFDLDGTVRNINIPNGIESKQWKNGIWFYYNNTLAIGNHKYRYITNDGLGFSDIHEPENRSKYISGPIVVRSNSEPVISDGYVTPDSGYPNTVFKYRIKYFDVDSDEAGVAKVYIDELPHTMVMSDFEADNGGAWTWFEYETKLTEGSHEFYFKFKDNNGSPVVRWPKEGGQNISVIEGPIVEPFKNYLPILGNGSVTPTIGHRNQLFSFTISYYDEDGDIPTNTYVIIDGIAYNLTRAKIAQNIYFYESELPLGEHYFHYVFWDEVNRHYVRYPESEGVEIIGPFVVDIPPQLRSSAVEPKLGTTETLFNFWIEYYDFENDTPTKADIVVDNITHNLTANSVIDQEGKHSIIYSYSSTLAIGEHSYYFTIRSGDFILRYPSTGYLSGPVVLELEQSEPQIHEPGTEPGTDGEEPIIPDNDTDDEIINNDKPEDMYTSEIDDIFTLMDYKLYYEKDTIGHKYTFILICKFKDVRVTPSECWLVLDGQHYLMSLQKTSDKIIYNCSLVMHLFPNEHYYHYLINVDMVKSEHRVPYKGEFIIHALELDEDVEEMNTEPKTPRTEKFIKTQQQNIIQLLFTILIVLAVVFFSFYRKYISLRKRK